MGAEDTFSHNSVEGLVWVVDVLERDAVELAFVDVGNAVIFASLGTTAGRLEVVFEPVRRKPMETHINNVEHWASKHTSYWYSEPTTWALRLLNWAVSNSSNSREGIGIP
ncbi:hypothetical protein RR48_10342 [Papilio machaon]|uniref:Uncharacterized protein n=1 Tax=Papilio machaon TaxID=76193 RepID=A0A194RG03_PAPMA|nr:hypothetical protein RR48_10342 [Papilio machaon]